MHLLVYRLGADAVTVVPVVGVEPTKSALRMRRHPTMALRAKYSGCRMNAGLRQLVRASFYLTTRDGAGGEDRTRDLQIGNLTHYRCATPAFDGGRERRKRLSTSSRGHELAQLSPSGARLSPRVGLSPAPLEDNGRADWI